MFDGHISHKIMTIHRCTSSFLLLLSLFLLTQLATSASSSPSLIDIISPPLRTRQTEGERALTENGRCGDKQEDGNHWRCPATAEEQAVVVGGGGEGGDVKPLELICCSQKGFCGKTKEHCGELYCGERPRQCLGVEVAGEARNEGMCVYCGKYGMLTLVGMIAGVKGRGVNLILGYALLYCCFGGTLSLES